MQRLLVLGDPSRRRIICPKNLDWTRDGEKAKGICRHLVGKTITSEFRHLPLGEEPLVSNCEETHLLCES